MASSFVLIAGVATSASSLFALGANELPVYAAICPSALSAPIVVFFAFLGLYITRGGPPPSLPSILVDPLITSPSPENSLALLSALVSTTLTLAGATYFSVPLSSLQVLLGATLGATLSTSPLPPDPIIALALSLALSPILSFCAALATRSTLSAVGASHRRYTRLLPAIAALSACATLALISVSGPPWLLQNWLTPWPVAAAFYTLFATAVAYAAHLCLTRFTGTSVPSPVVYNLTQDSDEEDDVENALTSSKAPPASSSPSSPSSPSSSSSTSCPAKPPPAPADTADLSDDVDTDYSSWAGDATFIPDERAPIFQALLISSMAGVAFAFGAADAPVLLKPLVGILVAFRLDLDHMPASRQLIDLAADLAADTAPALVAPAPHTAAEVRSEVVGLRLGLLADLVATLFVFAGMLAAGRRVMDTLANVNNRAKLSYARSFAVYIAATVAVLGANFAGLDVCMSYSLIASHAVTSVAYVPETERVFERVHEGLDVRLLAKMAFFAVAAPAFAAGLGAVVRFILGLFIPLYFW